MGSAKSKRAPPAGASGAQVQQGGAKPKGLGSHSKPVGPAGPSCGESRPIPALRLLESGSPPLGRVSGFDHPIQALVDTADIVLDIA